MLASSGTLLETSVCVMMPGGPQVTTFDLSDIELTHAGPASRYTLMGKHVSRDSIITDTYTKALQNRFPHLRFFHLSPGLVQTNGMYNQGVPWPMRVLMIWVVFPLAARTVGNTVASYAEIPMFWAANKKSEEMAKTEGFFLDQRGKKVAVSPFATDKGHQDAVFEKLKEYLKQARD